MRDTNDNLLTASVLAIAVATAACGSASASDDSELSALPVSIVEVSMQHHYDIERTFTGLSAVGNAIRRILSGKTQDVLFQSPDLRRSGRDGADFDDQAEGLRDADFELTISGTLSRHDVSDRLQ